MAGGCFAGNESCGPDARCIANGECRSISTTFTATAFANGDEDSLDEVQERESGARYVPAPAGCSCC
jgi:hypothetical protein